MNRLTLISSRSESPADSPVQCPPASCTTACARCLVPSMTAEELRFLVQGELEISWSHRFNGLVPNRNKDAVPCLPQLACWSLVWHSHALGSTAAPTESILASGFRPRFTMTVRQVFESIRQTNTSGAFHEYGAFTQRIDGIRTPFGITTSCPRISQRHSRKRRESSPSADHAVNISPPWIALLDSSSLPGSFPFPETIMPCRVTFPGFAPSRG